eukprot:8128787-Pyramimonas_sp.AAC.1
MERSASVRTCWSSSPPKHGSPVAGLRTVRFGILVFGASLLMMGHHRRMSLTASALSASATRAATRSRFSERTALFAIFAARRNSEKIDLHNHDGWFTTLESTR